MPDLAKFMGLATVSSAVLEKMVLNRFLAGMALILVFAVIAGSLIAALMMGGFYLAYQLMIEHGIAAEAAMSVTGIGAVLLILAFSLAIRLRIRRIHKILMPKIPKITIPSRIGNVAEAFMDGLMTPLPQQTAAKMEHVETVNAGGRCESCDA